MKLRRALCLTLAFSLILGTAGCGKKKDSSNASDSKISDAKVMSGDFIYTEDPDFHVDGMQGEVYDYCYRDGYLYINTGEWVSSASETDAGILTGVYEDTASDGDGMMEDDGYSVNRIYKVSSEGGTAELLAEVTSDDYYFDRMLVDKDNNLYITKVKYTDDDRNQTKMYKVENGELTDEKDLSKITDVSGDSWLSNLIMDENGDLIAFYDKEIRIYDKDLNEKAKASSEEYYDSTGITKDGDIIVIQTKYEDDKSSTIGKLFDREKGEFSQDFEIKDTQYIGEIIKGSGDYDFYFKSGDNFYGYKLKENKADKLVDLSKSDINTDMAGRIVLGDEGRIFISFYEGETKMASYVKADASEYDSRTVLTIMSVYGNYELKQKVLEYNKSQSKYRVNMVEYGDSEDPSAKISAEIAAGNLPDMYDLSGGLGNMSLDQCISKGLFADLTEYIDKDPDFSMDDLVPAVAKAMNRDGKVYYIASTFTVQTLVGKASEVGSEPGWTYSDMKSYVDSKDDDVFLFWSNNKKDMLREFLYTSGKDFVDWKTGEVYFDTQEFKDVLEMCNRGTNDEMEYNEDTESEPTRIKNGKLLFMEGDVTPSQMEVYDAIFQDDAGYIGYPTREGSGTYLNLSNCVALSEKSENKEAAWDFMKVLMSEDYQGKNYQNAWGQPTRQDVFEEFLNAQKATKETKDKYGNDIFPIEGSSGWEDFEVKLHPLNDEQVDRFKKIIDSADGVMEIDYNLTDIVLEEAEAYFKGDKSVDEVTGIIQNRVGTYVNENK